MAERWLGHPASAAVMAETSALMGFDVAARCAEPGALDRTDFVQIALLACDVAALRVLESEGVRFEAAAGHSLGEFAAMVAAGVLTFADAVRVVEVRGRAMADASDLAPGAMTALIGLSPEAAAEVCALAGRGGVLTVANENSAKQTVVSGSPEAIERAEALAATRGARAVRLRVAGAFHSPLMRPAVAPLRAALAATRFHQPRFPVVSNVSGRPSTRPAALRDLLARHVVSPVRWDASVRALAETGIDGFVEAGPGDTLTRLVRRTVPEARAVSVDSPDAAAALAAELRVEASR